MNSDQDDFPKGVTDFSWLLCVQVLHIVAFGVIFQLINRQKVSTFFLVLYMQLKIDVKGF